MMNRQVMRIASVLLALLIFSANAAADADKAAGKDEQPCPSSVDLEEMLPVDSLSVTEHVLQSADFELPYQAIAGTLPVKLGKDGPECNIFFTSYHAHSRGQTPAPLTFVFNGGPGASSAYLHIGALGPKRVLFHEDGSLPGPPARLVDNMQTWLRFTDLVFVDPVGTGYSRCRPSQGNKTEKQTEARAWGVTEDLTVLAKFIRLYLTRYNRWLSPKYLVGESYGGFRVAALSDLLQTDYGIALNGIVLVSPALEFELLADNEFSLLPWVITLPSYAATARHHGKATGGLNNDADLRKSLHEVELFAVLEYLPALAAADSTALHARLAEFIGLPAQRVQLQNARISPRRFSKELLRDSKLLVSIYDGSVTLIDPEPASPFPPQKDPLLIQLNTLLAAALNSLIREQLKFETDIPYEVLNWEVANRWNWHSGLDSVQGFVGVAGNLKNSMSANKELKVFIAHGIFDLITPYFGSVIVTRQMELNPAVAANLSLKIYRGGHTFYTNEAARRQFFEDANQFYTFAATPVVPKKKEH